MAKTTNINSKFLLLFALELTLSIAANDNAYPTIPEYCWVSKELRPVRREVYGGGRIFDTTHRYTIDMPSYGKKDGKMGQFLRLPDSIKNGSIVNISELKLSTHSRTHVDAPGNVFDHYFYAGFDFGALEVEVLDS